MSDILFTFKIPPGTASNSLSMASAIALSNRSPGSMVSPKTLSISVFTEKRKSLSAIGMEGIAYEGKPPTVIYLASVSLLVSE